MKTIQGKYEIISVVLSPKPMTQQVDNRNTIVVVTDTEKNITIAVDYMRSAHKNKLEAIRLLESKKK